MLNGAVCLCARAIFCQCLAFQRQTPGKQLVEHNPQAIDVAANVRAADGTEMLRGEVITGAENRPLAFNLFIAMPRETEVQERRVTLRRKQDIARFNIAVHPTRRIQGTQGLGRLPGDPQRGRQIEQAPRGGVGLERGPFQPGHDQKPRRPIELGFQDRNQVRMRNLPPNPGLAGKYFDGLPVLLPIFMQHLDRVSSRASGGHIHGPSPIDAGPLPLSNPCRQLPSANSGFHTGSIGFSDGVNKGGLKEGQDREAALDFQADSYFNGRSSAG